MVSDIGTVTGANTQSLEAAKRGRTVRRIGIAILVTFVIAGLFGLFGHRQATVTSTGSGYAVKVSYPRVTRGGLAANWSVRVERLDGSPLPAGVEVRSTADYFSIFDENGLDPEPASVWSDGRVLTWTFDPPADANALDVSFDARMQPNTRGWFDATTSLAVDGDVVASVSYRTWAVP